MIEQVDPETGTEGLMQVSGVGSGHDTYSHQVTGCIHEHGENKDVGDAGAKLGSVQTIQTAEEVLQENSSVNLCPGCRISVVKANSFYRKSGERARKLMMRSLHKMATEIILQGRRRWSPGIL